MLLDAHHVANKIPNLVKCHSGTWHTSRYKQIAIKLSHLATVRVQLHITDTDFAMMNNQVLMLRSTENSFSIK